MSKKNKFRNRKPSAHTQSRAQQPSVEVLPSLNLGYLNAATVIMPEFKMVHILLIGGGGIGAYLAQHIGRIMRVLYQSDRGVHLTIVDPDLVEYKNIGRQLFCDAEVGAPKAEALARRYGHAWGLNVSSYVGKFEDSLLLGTEMTLLVGAVDNAEARLSIADVLDHNAEDEGRSVWWIDCGNLQDTGRVLLGSASEDRQLHGAFSPDGKECYALPSPALQSPGLLEARPEEMAENEMSCAEMAAANLQSLNINARIAAEASDFITRLLVTKDLKRFACEVNIAAGSVRSYYNTPEEVARVIHQPVAYVRAQEKGMAAD